MRLRIQEQVIGKQPAGAQRAELDGPQMLTRRIAQQLLHIHQARDGEQQRTQRRPDEREHHTAGKHQGIEAPDAVVGADAGDGLQGEQPRAVAQQLEHAQCWRGPALTGRLQRNHGGPHGATQQCSQHTPVATRLAGAAESYRRAGKKRQCGGRVAVGRQVQVCVTA